MNWYFYYVQIWYSYRLGCRPFWRSKKMSKRVIYKSSDTGRIV